MSGLDWAPPFNLGMHHLSQSQFHNSSPQPQPPIDDKLRLPTELLILISSFVRQRNDLVTLCRVSKKFRIICTPLLYRVVTVDTRQERANSPYWLHLYKTLRDPITSLLVTHLDFRLVGDRLCGRLYKPGTPSYCQPCSSIGYDDALRKVIVSLRNLESLTIQCTLCSDSHNHDYLFDLQAPLLRQFSFHCLAKSAQRAMKSILLLPFMPQVTSLFLECDEHRICPNDGDSLQALVEKNDVAPNLHTLSIYGHGLPNHLLGIRPIERLCLNTWVSRTLGRYMDGFYTGISQSPGTLSHLFAIDVLQWLPRVIKEDPEPYRHLRYIGTVTLWNSEDASTLAMVNLAPLCNLEVMEVNQLRILDHYRIFHPVHGFFEILGDRHPLLRRVLLICRHGCKGEENSIKGADPVLWEKTAGQSWTPRPVPRLDYWEIVHDKLDEV